MVRSRLVLVSSLLLVISCGDDTDFPGSGSDGGTCGSCSTGFKCGSSGQCELNPTGYWVVTATDGWVSEKKPSGSAWDYPGGLPDLFVCLTINGNKQCTKTVDNSTKPVWSKTFSAATATALQSGVKFEYADEDLSSNDSVCTGTHAFATDKFKAGSAAITCGSSNEAGINLTLTAQ